MFRLFSLIGGWTIEGMRQGAVVNPVLLDPTLIIDVFTAAQ